MRLHSLFALLAALALTPALRAGSITLSDGKTLQGIVSLVDGGGGEANVQLQTPNNPPQSFKFADIRYAVFDGLAGGAILSGGGVPWVRTEIGDDRHSPIAQIAGDKITISDLQLPAPPKPRPKRNPNADPEIPADPAPAENTCFIFQKLDWDGEILAHVTLSDVVPHTGPVPPDSPKAALMICEGLDGLGPMAVLAKVDNGPVSFVRRGARSEDPSPVNTSRGAGSSWLKLSRSWDSVRALESADGVTWTPVGEARIEMDDKKGVYIGVAGRGPANITFDNIKLSGRRSLAISPGASDPRLRDVSVMLRDGTILAGMLESVTPDGQGKIKTNRRADQPIALKPGFIARAQFAPMTAEQSQTFLAANVGALTKDGDFLEGELKNIKDGSVTVSSIAFGLTTLEPGRVLGIVLQPPDEKAAARATAEVRLQDGSLIMADKLTIEKDQLLVEEPLVGPLKFKLEEVISITRK